MNKKEIAAILEEIAVLLEIKGENPFKSRAYSNSAAVLYAVSEEIDELVKTGKLASLKGIGSGLSEKITQLYSTGRLDYYDELKKSVPAGLLRLVQLPGLGPKKAKILYDKLGISSIEELEYACHENRLLALKGFGEKSQENIVKSILFFRKNQNRFLFSNALAEAESILSILKKDGNVICAEIAGSVRRKMEIVNDIDFVVATKHPGAVMEKFSSLPQVKKVIAKGDTKSGIILDSGIRADIRCVAEKEFPFALHHFTGSKLHNIAMRSRAQAMGIKINEYGLFKGSRLLSCRSEEEFFSRLGLAFIPPELREGSGEIESAEAGKLPELVNYGDLCGTFHVHTTYSDGRETLEKMAEQARKMGLKYVGISDHSRHAFYAHGMEEGDVKKQHAEIDRLNKSFRDFRIFKGVESDILSDGSLDYDEKTLKTFDFVIASVHSQFQMPEKEMTERIIKALENPYTTMLGHMTGRLLLSREPYALDVKKIIDTAAEHGKIIELNAHPYRLDIDWRHLKYAKKQGVKVSINPDAHNAEGLSDIDYGVGIARKGWLSKEDVINTYTLAGIEKYLFHETEK